MKDKEATGSIAAVAMSAHHAYGHLVVSLSGVVDSDTSPTVRGQFMALLLNERHVIRGLVIDLADADPHDVVGVARLMMIYWKTTGTDSALALVAPHGPAREAVFTAKLDWLAPVYPTVEQATATHADNDASR